MNKSIAIYIDSKDPGVETFPNVARAKFTFNDPIVCQEDEALLVSLIHARIPYSFYNIRTGVNDVFAFELDIISSDNSHKFYFNHRIAPGNYTISSLINELELNVPLLVQTYITSTTLTQPSGSYTFNTSLTNGIWGDNIAEYTFDGNGQLTTLPIINVQYNREISKFVFNANWTPFDVANKSVRFYHNFDENTLTYELGFEKDIVYDYFGTNDGVAKTLTSDNVVDVNNSIHTLHLRSNLATSSTISSLDKGFSNLLAIIPVQTNPGSIIFHRPSERILSTRIISKHINTLDIEITDNNGKGLNLNGLGFGVGILFEYVSNQVGYMDVKSDRHFLRLWKRRQDSTKEDHEGKEEINKDNKMKKKLKKKVLVRKELVKVDNTRFLGDVE